MSSYITRAVVTAIPTIAQDALLQMRDKRHPTTPRRPLVYMENNRAIPAKWRQAFKCEMMSENTAYADNIKYTMDRLGVRFTDGKGLHADVINRTAQDIIKEALETGKITE